jgi:peptide/nickel transport system ATP-binding protein
MSPLLTAKNLCRTFTTRTGVFARPAQLTAVADVSLEIAPKSAIGIAGESGCGKSTLAKLLAGLLPPTSGNIMFADKPLTHLSRDEQRQFRRSVQMVFQDPFSSLNPRLRVGPIIAEPLVIHRLVAAKDIEREVTRLLATVGLPADAANRYPHEFSGGQRQRIGIARALAVNPQLLIADEPVSALDLSIQAQILNLLQQLREQFALSLLLIAHDISVIRHLCDTVAIMYLGRIVEFGSCADLFSAPRHPYTQALLAAVPRIDRHPDQQRIVLRGDLPSPLAPPAGCPFHPRCPYAADICRTTLPPLAPQLHNRLAACHLSDKIFGDATSRLLTRE